MANSRGRGPSQEWPPWRKSRFKEEQIVAVLRESEAGVKAADLVSQTRDLDQHAEPVALEIRPTLATSLEPRWGPSGLAGVFLLSVYWKAYFVDSNLVEYRILEVDAKLMSE